MLDKNGNLQQVKCRITDTSNIQLWLKINQNNALSMISYMKAKTKLLFHKNIPLQTDVNLFIHFRIIQMEIFDLYASPTLGFCWNQDQTSSLALARKPKPYKPDITHHKDFKGMITKQKPIRVKHTPRKTAWRSPMRCHHWTACYQTTASHHHLVASHDTMARHHHRTNKPTLLT